MQAPAALSPANRDSADALSRAVLAGSEQPAQIAGRSGRFITRCKEKEDIAEQLIAVLDQRAENAILAIFRRAMERKIHDEDRLALRLADFAQ